MVRVTSALARIPVIKFRKGGLSLPRPSAGQAAPSSPGAPAAAASPSQMQPAATMSTSIPDIDLPHRYKRMPLSEEEIAHINGGGIV